MGASDEEGNIRQYVADGRASYIAVLENKIERKQIVWGDMVK